MSHSLKQVVLFNSVAAAARTLTSVVSPRGAFIVHPLVLLVALATLAPGWSLPVARRQLSMVAAETFVPRMEEDNGLAVSASPACPSPPLAVERARRAHASVMMNRLSSIHTVGLLRVWLAWGAMKSRGIGVGTCGPGRAGRGHDGGDGGGGTRAPSVARVQVVPLVHVEPVAVELPAELELVDPLSASGRMEGVGDRVAEVKHAVDKLVRPLHALSAKLESSEALLRRAVLVHLVDHAHDSLVPQVCVRPINLLLLASIRAVLLHADELAQFHAVVAVQHAARCTVHELPSVDEAAMRRCALPGPFRNCSCRLSRAELQLRRGELESRVPRTGVRVVADAIEFDHRRWVPEVSVRDEVIVDFARQEVLLVPRWLSLGGRRSTAG